MSEFSFNFTSHPDPFIFQLSHRALDKNEYNHITATYFLLAERKLRAYRQEQAQKRRPEQLSLAVASNNMRLSPNKDGGCVDEISSNEANSNNFLLPPNAGHLGVLRTPGADGTVSGIFQRMFFWCDELMN